MDLNVGVDVNFFRADVNFSNDHCYLITLQIFFHFDINQHQGPTNTPYRVLLILHTKFQQILPAVLEKMAILLVCYFQ